MIHVQFKAGVPAEKSRNMINQFIETNTGGMIKNMIPPGTIDRNTLMMLVNALYFKGNFIVSYYSYKTTTGSWKYAFEKNDTKNEPFHLLNGKVVNIPMMFIEGEYDVCHRADLDAKFLKLPFVDVKYFERRICI